MRGPQVTYAVTTAAQVAQECWIGVSGFVLDFLKCIVYVTLNPSKTLWTSYISVQFVTPSSICKVES